MKDTLRFLLVAVAAMFTFSLSGIAQVTPSADAYTNSAAATTNYGTASTLGVVSSTTSIQSSFIQFELSLIPSGFTGASIAKASLKLYVNTVTTAGSFNVDYVNGTWSEKTITASVSPALGTTIASSVPLTTAQAHDYIVIDVTAAVQAWLNGTQINDGLALVANSPLVATFDSKENATQSHSAELDIVFAGGGTGTITGVTAGAGMVGGGTSGNVTLSMIKTCASGQVLEWNGTTWVCANASGSGTITGVTAGTGLTGGGTTGNVTLSLNTVTTDARYAQLGASNAFTQLQAVNGTGQTLLQATSSALSASVVYGHSTNTSGNAVSQGVLGVADGPIGIGVFGASNGSAGIGVEGKGSQNGVLGYTGTTSTIWSNYGAGVHGDNGFPGTGVLGTVDNGQGVMGLVSNGGTGVYGHTSSGSGVYGLSDNGVGVFGVTQASGGSANGVQGASTNATAVRGDDAGSGSGVVGTSVNGYGVYGTSANGTGVFGGATGTGTAGYFQGNVQLTGTITSYNNTPTVANGVPIIVYQFSFSSNGSGNNIYQDLYTPSSDGIYRITAFQECTATSGGGTYFSLGLAWTLPTGGSGGNAVFGPDCLVLTGSSGSVVAHVKGGTPMQYNYAGMNAPFQTMILIEQLL